MAEITRKRVGELLRGVFQILIPIPEGLHAKTVLERLQTVVPPTDFEKAMYPKQPDVRRYEKIVRFSTIRTVKAGWLIKDKGIWSLTDEGRKAYQQFPKPEEFSAEAHRLYAQWSKQQPQSEGVTDEEVQAANPVIALTDAEESSWSEIESYLTSMPPFKFQELVEGLLRGMDYHVPYNAPPGPDRGIDLIAQSDPLGTKGPRVKVQVKRRADSMTVKELRSFLAVLSDGDIGLFVSAGGFTQDAKDEARNQEKRRVRLVDLKQLFDLWVEYYDKIPEKFRQLLPLKAIYFLRPDE